jgi:hypothetical protein
MTNTYTTPFGIHSIMLLDRDNGFKPFKNGYLPIIGGLTLTTSQEDVELKGGSNAGAWAIENGDRADEISFTVRQLSAAMVTEASGAILTELAASATGSITSSLINTKGTSILNGTTGIASVSIKAGSEADLKAGVYWVEAITTTTVNVYGSTDIDFISNGADVSFQNDEYELLASDVTVTASTASTLTGLGLEITGGSGTIGMTVGNIASFQVAPAHGGIESYSIGESGVFPSYVALIAYGQKTAEGDIFQVRIPKVKLSGLPINMTEKAFFETEVTGRLVQAQDWLSTKKSAYFMDTIKGA